MLIRLLLTVEQRAAIGDLVAESARLEALLEVAVSQLAKLDKDTHVALVSGNNLDKNLEILKELGERKLKSNRRRAEFSRLISRIKALNSERVIAVHGSWQPKAGYRMNPVWVTSHDGKREVEVVHRARRSGALRALSGDRVEKLASQINTAFSDLVMFLMKAFPRFRPAHRTKKPKVP